MRLMEKPNNILKEDLALIIDCTVEGRIKCKAICCKKHVHSIKCPLLDACQEKPEIRPVFCRIYPLFVEDGVLKVHDWTKENCPNVGQGNKQIWKNVREGIISVFGIDYYKNISEIMNEDV